MPSLTALRAELTEQAIASNVTRKHDHARAVFPLSKNNVADFYEFSRIIGEYYNHHFAACITNGARLPREEAIGRAEELLTRVRGREGGDYRTAGRDTINGMNGGLREILDQLNEGFKAESVERYIRAVLDRHVRPLNWEDKISIIKQILAELDPPATAGAATPVDPANPGEFAAAFERAVRAYQRGLQQVHAAFRSMRG